MAIVLPMGRPAIDIVQNSFTSPEEPWAHLGDPGPRAILQQAIPSVCQFAFAAGPDLLIAGVPVKKDVDGGYTLLSEEYRFLDFRHEVVAAEPLRVRIDEILPLEVRPNLQLVRAKLPDGINPLRLSVRRPEELIGREVALIGYPGQDSRSDLALSDRIFRGTYGVKRLMPGRINGISMSRSLGRVLEHDCLSLGGCAGGPLVDIETGEVLGVHFAGEYLKANYAVPGIEFASNPKYAEYGVLFAGPLPTSGPVPVPVDRGPADEQAGNGSEAAVARKLPPGIDAPAERKQELSDEEAAELERIILLVNRPAYIVDRGRFQPSDFWVDILAPHEARLEAAIRAVGKLRLHRPKPSSLGTAFMVGSDIALTASYVATEFASGSGEDVTLQPGLDPVLDFSEALGLASGEATARIVGVRFIHPFFQVALLQLEEVPAGVTFLDLAAQLPSDLSGRKVVMLSYVYESADRELYDLRESVYGNKWGRLFVHPGEARQLGQTPGLPNVSAMTHDCSTLTAAAGAPIIDLGTGYVLGVQTHSEYLKGSYAQPAWELARDPYVWRHAIRFRPEPRPLWLDRWRSPQPVPQPSVTVSSVRSDRWTVDKVPIDWKLERPKRLEQLLTFVDLNTARYYAENVGLPLGLINWSLGEARLLWREILNKASNAGLLRLLVEEIARQPEYAAFAPHLREFL